MAILSAAREKESRQNRFLAAIQGIDLGDEKNKAKEKFDEVRTRAEAKLTGRSQDEIEFDALGLEIEIEN